MMDLVSLHQHPPNGRRSATEEALFKQALSSLSVFYAHRATVVFRLTKFPLGYPEEGYVLPAGANVQQYPNRGWYGQTSSLECCSAIYDPEPTPTIAVPSLAGVSPSRAGQV